MIIWLCKFLKHFIFSVSLFTPLISLIIINANGVSPSVQVFITLSILTFVSNCQFCIYYGYTYMYMCNKTIQFSCSMPGYKFLSALHFFFLCNIRDEIKLNDYSILSSHLMAVIDPMMSKIYISVNAIVMLCKMYTVSKTYMVQVRIRIC